MITIRMRNTTMGIVTNGDSGPPTASRERPMATNKSHMAASTRWARRMKTGIDMFRTDVRVTFRTDGIDIFRGSISTFINISPPSVAAGGSYHPATVLQQTSSGGDHARGARYAGGRFLRYEANARDVSRGRHHACDSAPRRETVNHSEPSGGSWLPTRQRLPRSP